MVIVTTRFKTYLSIIVHVNLQLEYVPHHATIHVELLVLCGTVGREIFMVNKFSRFSRLWSNREIKHREI